MFDLKEYLKLISIHIIFVHEFQFLINDACPYVIITYNTHLILLPHWVSSQTRLKLLWNQTGKKFVSVLFFF